jgi:predicted AAA+ superfamily ATPase
VKQLEQQSQEHEKITAQLRNALKAAEAKRIEGVRRSGHST